jgi:hypothetical protein
VPAIILFAGTFACGIMKRKRLKKKSEPPEIDDLSFSPPYSEHAKYLALADKFLSLNGARRNVVSIDSSRYFKRVKKTTEAA